MISRRDVRRMNLAISMAYHSKMKHRLGAAIYSASGESIGWNKHKTHPQFATRTIHAEQAAILDGAKRGIITHNATAYVARVSRAGHVMLAKPCAQCLHYLKGAGIRRVVWTDAHMIYGEMTL